ncbi:MAG: hypothetical protein BA863_18470 [Desulfovibrio sp. S3730MH75]|nr:MAG: hypothetical protein BA863_18470 [Desulfovibrio sp. S3730MH75]
MEFRVLQAKNGDSLLVSWEHEGEVRNLLMDGGMSSTYKTTVKKGDLYKALEQIKRRGQRIDLLILSHVDEDHVAGLLKGFKNNGLLENLTDKVWFNSGILIDNAFNQPIDETHYLSFSSSISNLTSINQGVLFEQVIEEKGIWIKSLIEVSQVYTDLGAKITILSPTRQNLKKLLKKWKKEAPSSLTGGAENDYGMSFDQLLANDVFAGDNSDTNGSSIALLIEIGQKRLLLLGDAYDEVVINSIKQLTDENGFSYSSDNPLAVDYIKLSHHDSQYNTSPEFLKLIDCQNFVISTNGSGHGHPDKRTLARVADRHPHSTIWFNYHSVYSAINTSLNSYDSSKINCGYKCSTGCFEL